jgi:acyl-CoA reductase-like NAD-dependent aldehyde dehydrogenase
VIARACVDRVARLHLELGGKDPFIVCPDVAGDRDRRARRRMGGVPERRAGLHER